MFWLDYKSITDAAQIDNGYGRIVTEIFTEFMHVAVQGIAVIVIIVLPYKFHEFRRPYGFPLVHCKEREYH